MAGLPKSISGTNRITCYSTKLLPNTPVTTANSQQIMDTTDTPERGHRKLPNFMYGATYPRDNLGSGGPAYSGAVEWLQKHQDYLNQSLKYIQRYPNLVQERVLDPFWEFMAPLIYNNNLLFKYNDFLHSEFGSKETFQLGDKFNQPLPTAAAFFKSSSEMHRHDYDYPIRRAFICYDRTSEHQLQLKHLIVDQLEPFLSIRTNPTPEQAKDMQSLDICRAICGSVFLMLINDNLLRDQVAVHLLSIAIAYKTPIILMRESGYTLPSSLPDTVVTYVKTPENAPFKPKHNKIAEVNSKRAGLKEKNQHRQPQSGEIDANEGVDEASLRVVQEQEEAERQKQEEKERNVSLAAKIRELFRDALVLNPVLIGPTLSALYEKLAGLTGATFPGDLPQLALDAATIISRPGNLAHMTLPEKPIYKSGNTARTTVGFHHSMTQRGHNSNNNCNSGMTTPNFVCGGSERSYGDSSYGGYAGEADSGIHGAEDTRSEARAHSVLGYHTTSSVLGTGPTKSGTTMNTEEALHHTARRLIPSRREPSVLVPTPHVIHKLTRSQIRAYSVPFQYKQRPNLPSDSRLTKFRPGSLRPSSARTRVLLNSTIQTDDNYMDY